MQMPDLIDLIGRRDRVTRLHGQKEEAAVFAQRPVREGGGPAVLARQLPGKSHGGPVRIELKLLQAIPEILLRGSEVHRCRVANPPHRNKHLRGPPRNSPPGAKILGRFKGIVPTFAAPVPSMRTLRFTALLALLTVSCPALAAPPSNLTTHAERTGFLETGRYAEVEQLCRAFAAAYPKNVRVLKFGTTPEGRPMLALVAARGVALDANAARAKQRPILLFQGGIHAGEIDGKDAGFLLLRNLLDGTIPNDPLARLVIVFVPIFNIDGHERFGPNNRPNQRGPAAMGWRVTAQNQNLNRDYTKADTPEMVAMLRLLQTWDPILYADMHVTDGAKFRHDIAVMLQPSTVGPEPLRALGARISEQLLADLTAAGNLPLWFYPAFDAGEDPASGFSFGISSPRFSDGYWRLHNRFGVLVETHSWHEYKERVAATYTTLLSFVNQAASSGGQWLAAAKAADAETSSLAGKMVTLSWKHTGEARTIDFLGYEYKRVPSDISGQLWTQYDETKPAVWKIPLRANLAPSMQMEAPKAGYLVPAAYAAMVSAKLDLHGIRYQRLAKDREFSAREAQTFRAKKVTLAKESFEGRTGATVVGEWSDETQTLAAGSLFVPIAQRAAPLVMALLEPQATDSFVSWGFFNNSFEQKEYMEAYVAEDAAREMLAQDPKLKEAFEARLQSDTAFAASPAQRLDFFVRRHPSYDARFNLYPIVRTNVAP